jgi:catechol 2,3-dioxygenase-like lactoylglutathione lyase family enzyme
MLTNYPVNPRIRALGKARIDLALCLKDSTEWDQRWKPPSNPFPFTWGDSWKQCIEYRVDDFAAEVGFFTDVLGFAVHALDRSYAMFTSPQQDFYFAIVPTVASESPTSPDAFRLQFMVRDVTATYQELLRRGIAFELAPQPLCPTSSIIIASFRTPNGISVEIWGLSMQNAISPHEMRFSNNLAALSNSNHKDKPEKEEEEDDDEFDDEDEDNKTDEDWLNDDNEEDREDVEENFDEEDGEDEDTDETEEDEEVDYEEDLDEEVEEEDEDDFDDDEYEIDDDEDEDYDDDDDDYSEDKYSSSTVKIPTNINWIGPSTQLPKSNSISSDTPHLPEQTQRLEYIDLQID